MKVAHFYWGNESISYLRYFTLYSFRKFNPDWHIRVIRNNFIKYEQKKWVTCENQDKFVFDGIDYSDRVPKLDVEFVDFEPSMLDLPEEIVRTMSDVHIKDILNWKILARTGGLVSDMDIIYFKPVESEIDINASASLTCFDKGYKPVSFLYSGRPNEFFEDCYQQSLIRYSPDIYESCGSPCINYLNVDSIRNAFPKLLIQRFMNSIVFPFFYLDYSSMIDGLYFKDLLPNVRAISHCVGLHWYGGNQLSQDFNNVFNEINLNEHNNTVANLVKEIICLNPSNQN